MAIEKDSVYRQQEKIAETSAENMGLVDIDVADNILGDVQMLEDGSAIVGEQEIEQEIAFDSNLAEFMDDSDLGVVSNDIMEGFQEDKSSRKEWEETYKKGLGLLGFQYKEKSEPFMGASSVSHPVLAEAVTQFQAQAYRELLPAGGPVRTQILGKDEHSDYKNG